MNFAEERELFANAELRPQARPMPMPDRSSLQEFVAVLASKRWRILLIMLVALLLGGLATLAMQPVYEANLIIQVADSAGPPKSILGDAATAFDIKTPASAEMEIMRSRMIVGPAVDKNLLSIVARPRWPWPRNWRIDDPGEPSAPGLGALLDRFHSAQRIAVSAFEVPAPWEGQKFIVRDEGGGRYTLHHRSIKTPIAGKVGEALTANLGNGRLSLNISQLKGGAGTEFIVMRNTRGEAIRDLQDSLKLAERGRQSGIIEATLRDTDAGRVAAILNEIGTNYVRQNLDRTSAEAAKSLSFLDTQLPELKRQMEKAERAYSAYRAGKGTVSLPDEAKDILDRRAELKGRLLEVQQNRRDLLTRVGAEHPALRALDGQVAALEREIRDLQSTARQLPATQEDAAKLERDAKASSDLYQQLRNTALQLQLVREGRIGNSRIIDTALPAEKPVQPNPAIVLGGAVLAGAALSLLALYLRWGMDRTVKSAAEVEASTGLDVYAPAIPTSKAQTKVAARWGSEKILALRVPDDPAIESLRQLRTVLQRQMHDRKNNRLLITGPSKGVGVEFIAANLATIFAASGKRILLVDANLRHGALDRYLRTERSPGLGDLIAGTCTRQQATKATGICRLDFIAPGSATLTPGVLAVSPTFVEFLDQVSKEYDAVLVTAPPVLSSADTLSMASSAATVVLVTRAHKTLVDEISQSARRLAQAGQFSSGVVVNGI
jgi:tyrosine-protein kinase Etk/Wzc